MLLLECANVRQKQTAINNVVAGCYPQCPLSQPFFDEDSMTCVSWEQCGCYDDKGNHYNIGQKTASENCYDWYVT